MNAPKERTVARHAEVPDRGDAHSFNSDDQGPSDADRALLAAYAISAANRVRLRGSARKTFLDGVKAVLDEQERNTPGSIAIYADALRKGKTRTSHA